MAGAVLASSRVAAQDSPIAQIQQSVAPFLAGQAGRRTLLASTVLLPIALGVGIFAAVVMTSARPRATDPIAAPTPAPVATVAPTPAPAAEPTLAIPAALGQPPAAARLVVSDVGAEGLSLRRSPGVGERLKVWREGSEMADLGETAEYDGKIWKRVRDPDGNVGWMAGELLADPSVARPGPTRAPAAPPYASGGVGLTLAEWNQTHGQPTKTSILYEYDGGKVLVGHLEGKVMHIERVWRGADVVSLDAARDEAKAYIPADSTLTQSIDSGDGQIIDIYSSPSLESRFGPTAWNGGQAGTFAVKYKFRATNDRMVTSAMFRLGNSRF